MLRLRLLVPGLLVALVLPLVPALLAPGASVPGGSVATAVERKPTYRAKEGPTFNTAIGEPAQRRAILDKIIQTIRHTSPKGTIKIMTWNFMNPQAADALIERARRGTTVRVLMDASNNDVDTDNPSFRRLKAGLAATNGKREKNATKSFARMCKGSCRGKSGAAHTKMFLFDKVGLSRDVLIQGSANLTTASAANQWNEIYTYVGRTKLYDFAEEIFDEMWLDQPRKNAYRAFEGNRYSLYFSPYYGKDFKGDPVQKAMDDIRCFGAENAGNANGRTIVRSAPDVIRGQRGNIAARRLKALWDQGCDVRVAYTVMGVEAKRILTAGGGRGPVPIRHLVQDFDGDGDFDNYFHLKVLTINGRLGADRTAHVTFNGSANTSDGASRSDEQIGKLVGRRNTLLYQRFIDRWFENPPPNAARRADAPPNPDPYQHVDMD
ncbi:unannotated protein [freshwater metagenome]|uniref:Unannotated protein n=1 Tax=freshwater metagenome TaxID=449393 RepID=A0A6J6TEH2_9ZZZZ